MQMTSYGNASSLIQLVVLVNNDVPSKKLDGRFVHKGLFIVAMVLVAKLMAVFVNCSLLASSS